MNIRNAVYGTVGMTACVVMLINPLLISMRVRGPIKKEFSEAMTPEELLKQVTRLKELGLDIRGNIPESGTRAEDYATLISQRMRNNQARMSESRADAQLAAGSLHIYIVKNPSSWDYRTNQVNRFFKDLNGSEWIGIFRDSLNCPMEISDDLVPLGENTNRREAYRALFQQSIPQYRLLGRMWDTYGDALYEPAEINELKEECLMVQPITTNKLALDGLSKLIEACEEALKSNLGLYLASD